MCDTGAYVSSMASSYNSRMLASEVLVSQSEIRCIRARQSFKQHIENETMCNHQSQ